MDVFVALLMCVICVTKAANAQLQLSGGDAFINRRVLLNCTLPSAATIVTWHSSDKSNSYETVAVIQEYSNGRCSQSPNSNLTCTCNFSLFTCAINSVNLSNDGQRWRCSASINSATMYSNTHTISVLTANAQLQLSGGDAFLNTRVLLKCTLPSAATIVTWHSSDKSNNYETVAVIQEFSNGRCSQSPNSNLTCTCNSTLFTCAINSVKLSNDGQRWRCSASINSTTMYSNTHTISVSTANAQLQLNGGDAFLNTRVLLSCTLPSAATIVTWHSSDKSNNYETVAVIQEFSNGRCSQSPNSNLTCTCNSTLFTCAINSVKLSNDGQRWRCSASINSATMYSNIHTVSVSTANAQLQLNGGDAFLNTRVLLNCTLPSAATIVTWHSSDKSNSYETVAVIQEYSNGRCSQSPNSNLTCTCNSTLFTCAINSVNLSNDGQRWRCSASINSTTMYSNTHTISVLTANAQLQLNGGDAFLDTRVLLNCTLPSAATIVTWHLSDKSHNYETVAVIQEFSNGRCSQSPNSNLTCTCNSTLFTCAINSVNLSNDGERWRCSASINSTTMYSNTHTISVLIKPGRCPRPRPGTVGICLQRCRSDNDCPGAQKCCSNGCGNECRGAV
ncbi:uncharacterized protein LOC127836087 isoform X7 [Dreissena polymorpha]|uniref:uncharacterized protein LOC127836087 isoform X7 n=1 Tax=Dreissena polymorpha TaxID=45954 RepID=UPI0022642762|nr:uncharacterized protein LOC127836087 isoform X7 [Dreissena polymorpha]